MHNTRSNIKEIPIVLTHENCAFHVIPKTKRDYVLVRYLVGISNGCTMWGTNWILCNV